jgi:hypothetical protein
MADHHHFPHDLANAVDQWSTPNTPSGGPNTKSTQTHTGGLDLDGQVIHWTTPTAHDQHERHQTHAQGGNPITNQVHQWQTPATDSFRSRGGDRKGEQGLDQQARLWGTPSARDWKSGDASEETMNRNARRPLNEQAEHWGTPMASERSHSSRDVDHGIQLANQTDIWHTPRSTTGGYVYDRGGHHNPRPTLQGSAENWATPRAEDSESAGNHPNASDSLTGQSRMWNTPHAPRAHDSNNSETSYLARQISSLQGPPSPDGKICWCGTLGCALPTHKRKLNPIFETWLMGWRLSWLVSVPVHYGRLEMEWFLYRQRVLLYYLLGES